MWRLKYEKERHPAEEFALSGGVMGSKNLILQAVDVAIHFTDLSHIHMLDVTPTMILPPSNLTVFWMNLGSLQVPTGLLQYLW